MCESTVDGVPVALAEQLRDVVKAWGVDAPLVDAPVDAWLATEVVYCTWVAPDGMLPDAVGVTAPPPELAPLHDHPPVFAEKMNEDDDDVVPDCALAENV